MSQPTWTMRDGSVVPIVGMNDEHLMNTVRYLVRHARWLRHQAKRGRDIRGLEREHFDTMTAFAHEVKRRGLDRAAPGGGVGAGVIRKDVFQVEPMPAPPGKDWVRKIYLEETPIDTGRTPGIDWKP